MSRTLRSAWFPSMSYEIASLLQASLQQQRIADEIPDTLLQLTHPHVYTIGRRGDRSHVLWDDATLAVRGIEVCEADRGGMVTYHGPGQLVGYPIVDLGRAGDLVGYVRDLEETIIRALTAFGVHGDRVDGMSGVWVGLEKIAAVGVRVTRGVTKHGYAVNVSPDLSLFGGIVPCGIMDRGVTSIENLTGRAPLVEVVAREVEGRLAEVLGSRVEPMRTLDLVAGEPA